MFSEDLFINRIHLDNPWWESGAVSSEYSCSKPRLALQELVDLVTDKALHRAVLLMGPRRVGKTWLIQHLIGKLLTEYHVEPNRILFIPIDVPVYHGSSLEELLLAAGRCAKVNVRKDSLFVCFDEIQYQKDWELHLKTLADGYANIKFIASGSAAAVLAKGSRESGAGRFTDLKLSPLSFREYVYLVDKTDLFSPGKMNTSHGEYEVPQVESLETVNRLFLDYLNFGGYPELVLNDTVKGNPRQFIQRDIVDKVLLRDLPSLYHIEDVRDLHSFFSYLAFHTGMVTSYEALSQGSGHSKHNVQNFIRYLEEAFLIARLERVDINASKLQRATQFKVYLTNMSLRASMFQPIVKDDDSMLGYAVETAVASQFGIGEVWDSWRYANWRDGRRQGEVDFLHVDPGTQRPDVAFEVKWSDGPFDHPAELTEALQFVERNEVKRFLVTTRTLQGIKRHGETEIVYLPTALFAYMGGGLALAK